MNLETLPAIITLLIALSVATERFVEIIKSMSTWLNDRKEDVRTEGRRRAVLQVLAVVGGIGVTFVTRPVVGEIFPDATGTSGVLALGLLASGGSGFWNSMLGYVTSLKDLKREAAAQARKGDSGPRRIAEPAEGVLKP